ncbi:probable ATP-dependent RNA helicase DDX58 [Dendronephthya gigantea]|uniref:probable ATP-dependent RNA helicase DDX58 n=1 Tax=Dendronephthya gigantea TaxID=151771 RepID=UPI00106C2DEA|nr:probable ATP-dependent RNA helicase DDX58 [Dendronephthya gigantea]
MVEGEWKNVKRRERYIREEIDPLKLLRILERDTLTKSDCENIQTACNNHGPIHATENELLRRLEKRGPQAFSKFVKALRETGQDHAAQLLDPKCEVTGAISNEKQDERVLEAGVAADIRVKIFLLKPTEEQVKELETFCDRFKKSHCDETGDLRQHFNGFLSENVEKFVNLVKSTYDIKSQLILIFRFSDVDAANTFWHDFTNGNLKSIIKEKLQSFPCQNNCFKDEDIQFDIVVDEEDFTKVYNTLKDPKEYGEILVDGMEKQELKLREYQLELAKPALEGRNSIICAPTGSGKTFVAMEVIKHITAKPDHKFVAFIVNTVSLVEQQQSYLERYLPYSVSISSACGSYQDIHLPTILKENNVVVMTAQLLLNCLKKKPAVDEEDHSGGVKISQFSLLVFDECHHTTKDHPYNEIMRWYLRHKFEAESPILPQIIGLSASLGIGTGNHGSGSKAEEHIMGLLANMDIHDLQVYTGESQDVSTNITPISRDESNVFHRTIDDVMCNIEKMLSPSQSSDRSTYQHGSQPYENWVVKLCSAGLDRDKLTCAEHLKFYNNSLMMNIELRTEDALQYLRKSISPLNHEQSTEVEKKLDEFFVNAERIIKEDPSHCEPNPFLKKLETRLQEKFSSDDGGKSKGIIFVRTRESATALVNWMKNSQILKDLVKNPTSVIGCGQRNGKVGMPKAQQDKEIKSFRDGECNVIVATSVLLEGIDIPECNFAINYGMPGNEITFMQARGRVRSNDPVDYQYDIIVPRDQVMLKQRDLQKEKLMNETIKKVEKETKKENFREKVEKRQRVYYEYLKNLTKASSNVNLVPEDVNFHCVKCDKFACKARDIKKFSTAFIVPNYEKNLHNAIFEEDTPKIMCGGLNRNSKTFCKDCRRDWGNRAKNEFGEFPLIKIESFRVKNSSKSVDHWCKKWKDFPFDLETFNPDTDLNN